MWALILVFTLVSNSGRGVSVATSEIPGFSSKQTCMAAGQSVPDIRRYVCVEVR
ncbi:MAG: hypothetical protein IKA48_00580 [Fibrobacter sp.]|nr:hypothetical protein [Fibrobacter sp.]